MYDTERVKRIVNPPVGNGQVNQAHLAYLRWLDKQRQLDYQELRTVRDYYNGQHATRLTKRLRAFLEVKPGVEFNLNFMRIPVDVIKERLTIKGFDADDQSQQLGDWWQAARMDGKQKAVHKAVVRDGKTFVIVGWDEKENRPTFDYNLAFDGSNGVMVAYDEERQGVVSFAAKIWNIEDDPAQRKRQRLNFYTSDSIYKFSRLTTDIGDWQPYSEKEEEEWPIRWVDAAGRPLGVPVIPFMNDDDATSELVSLVGPQNVLNKSMIDFLAAADVTGFGMKWKVGGSDPGNAVVAPGSIAYDENPETRWGDFAPSDLSGLARSINDAKSTFAQISRIPLSYFQVTGQVASSDTQKADDTGLVSKVEDRAVTLGNSWEDCMILARRLSNVFGGPKLNEDVPIRARWDSFERVDKRATERTLAETNEIKERIFTNHLMNNVPRKLAARLAGYDDDTAGELVEVERPFLDGSVTQSGASGAVETTVTGAITDNLETDKGLNGAQINAALDVLGGVVAGTTTATVAIELLVSVGISRERATKMVTDTKANAAEPTDTTGITQ